MLWFKSKLEKLIDVTFERSKLYIDLGENIDVPDCLSTIQLESGFKATYKLPLGIQVNSVEKAIEALKIACNGEIEWRLDGRILHMTAFTQKIPDRVEFSLSHLPQVRHVPLINLGLSRRGVECLNYATIASPMTLILGATGYGKSKLLDFMIAQLLRQHTEIYIGDPKLDFEHFTPHITDYDTESDGIRDMVGHVSGQIVPRIKWIRAKGYSNIIEYNQHEKEKLETIFLIIDEALDFDVKDEKFWGPITHIARKGRSAGVYCILSVQRAAHDSFPLVVRNNIGQRISFRVENESDSQTVLGSHAAYHLPPIPGRCLYKTDRIREMQVPYISQQQIKDVLHEQKGKDHTGV